MSLGLFNDDSVIRQRIRELEKMGIIESKRLPGRGRPKVLTASVKPIENYLSSFLDRELINKALEYLSCFPELRPYFLKKLKILMANDETLAQTEILNGYYTFIFVVLALRYRGASKETLVKIQTKLLRKLGLSGKLIEHAGKVLHKYFMESGLGEVIEEASRVVKAEKVNKLVRSGDIKILQFICISLTSPFFRLLSSLS